MKLIDILVEELPKRGGWPDGADHAWCDPDGEIRFRNGGCEPDFYPESDVDIECRVPNPYYEDESRYIITREQYEAALSAKNEGWIEWGGGECPIENGFLVDVNLRNGRTEYAQKAHFAGGYASYPFWRSDNAGGDIIAYRLHQPQEAEQTEADDEADLNECIGQDAVPVWNGEGAIPPVGYVCERSWAGDEWLSCEILFASNQIVVVKLKESGIEDAYNIGDVTFRPICSEADRKRDESLRVIYEILYAGTSTKQDAADIYNAIAAGEIPGVKLED